MSADHLLPKPDTAFTAPIVSLLVVSGWRVCLLPVWQDRIGSDIPVPDSRCCLFSERFYCRENKSNIEAGDGCAAGSDDEHLGGLLRHPLFLSIEATIFSYYLLSYCKVYWLKEGRLLSTNPPFIRCPQIIGQSVIIEVQISLSNITSRPLSLCCNITLFRHLSVYSTTHSKHKLRDNKRKGKADRPWTSSDSSEEISPTTRISMR